MKILLCAEYQQFLITVDILLHRTESSLLWFFLNWLPRVFRASNARHTHNDASESSRWTLCSMRDCGTFYIIILFFICWKFYWTSFHVGSSWWNFISSFWAWRWCNVWNHPQVIMMFEHWIILIDRRRSKNCRFLRDFGWFHIILVCNKSHRLYSYSWLI